MHRLCRGSVHIGCCVLSKRRPCLRHHYDSARVLVVRSAGDKAILWRVGGCGEMRRLSGIGCCASRGNGEMEMRAYRIWVVVFSFQHAECLPRLQSCLLHRCCISPGLRPMVRPALSCSSPQHDVQHLSTRVTQALLPWCADAS
jgi:hypothetical protein